MLAQAQDSLHTTSPEPSPSSAETQTSGTKMNAFQPSQYRFTVDVVDDLIPEEWLNWDYGAIVGLDLLEQLDTTESGLPDCEPPEHGPRPNLNTASCPLAWSGFDLELDSMWMDPSPCDDDIEVQAARPHGVISDQVLFKQMTDQVSSESQIRPTRRTVPSFASTSSGSSSEQLDGFAEIDTLPFPLRPSQEDDRTKKPIPSQTPSEDSPSHLTTPPPSPSRLHDLPSRSKKRKAPTEDPQEDDTASDESHKLRILQLADHSVSEKRYRTKLNVVLATLRDKVPSLRVIAKQPHEYAYREGGCKLERPEASSKFDKATIVSKAVEYILYLETCNKRLSQEHVALKENIDAIQKITVSGLRRPE